MNQCIHAEVEYETDQRVVLRLSNLNLIGVECLGELSLEFFKVSSASGILRRF